MLPTCARERAVSSALGLRCWTCAGQLKGAEGSIQGVVIKPGSVGMAKIGSDQANESFVSIRSVISKVYDMALKALRDLELDMGIWWHGDSCSILLS